jgi:superfamily I DNA and RNA helicase
LKESEKRKKQMSTWTVCKASEFNTEYMQKETATKQPTASKRFEVTLTSPIADYLAGLNAKQREAVEYGIKPGKTDNIGPLLVIAGAGTGKTKTLSHRVAHLVANGANPHKILLLTFSRRAAGDMTRRVRRIVASVLKNQTTFSYPGQGPFTLSAGAARD